MQCKQKPYWKTWWEEVLKEQVGKCVLGESECAEGEQWSCVAGERVSGEAATCKEVVSWVGTGW